MNVTITPRKAPYLFSRHADKRFHERTPQADPLQRWAVASVRAVANPLVLSRSEWKRGSTRVYTAYEWAPYLDTQGRPAGEGPQYHLISSWAGKRSRTLDVGRLLRAFGLSGAHYIEVPNPKANEFYIAVDAAHRTASIVDATLGPRYHIPCPCLACDVAPLVGKVCRLHEAK